MPVGSAGYKFTPGQPPVTSQPAEPGEYPLVIGSRKPAFSNPSDPKKFPSLQLTIAIKGTEDEVNKGEKTLTHYFSLSPNQFSAADIFGCAYATGFQEPLEDEDGNPVTYSKRSDPGCRLVSEWVLRMVDAAIASEVVIPAASLEVDNYQGRKQNKVTSWGVPGDAPAAGGESEATPEPEPEEAPKSPPTKPAKKGKK